MMRLSVALPAFAPVLACALACGAPLERRALAPVVVDDGSDEEPAPVKDPACAGHEDELADIAAAFDAERTRKQIPGAAIALVLGDCLFARGFGTERQGGAAVDEHTRFQLASLTKTLTAVTALSLEQDGLLDRTRPIAELVPTTSTATLEDMLAHRAGYPTELIGANSLDLATYIEQGAATPMWAPPDEVWLYSNAGFALAGLALANAAGVPFEQLVQERVFVRAGMADAVMGATLTGDEQHMAHGHGGTASNPEPIAPTESYLASTYYGPMGGAFASAADLTHLMRALMDDGPMLAAASIDDMATSRGPAYGGFAGYGQGLFTGYDGTIFHSGSVFGFLCEMDVNRAARVGVAVLSAADWDFPSETLYGALADLLPPPPGPPVDDAPGDSEIVGSYVDAAVLGAIEVSNGAAGLRIAIASADIDTELVAYGPGSYGFYYPEWGMELEASFQRGPSGALYVVTLVGVGTRQ